MKKEVLYTFLISFPLAWGLLSYLSEDTGCDEIEKRTSELAVCDEGAVFHVIEKEGQDILLEGEFTGSRYRNKELVVGGFDKKCLVYLITEDEARPLPGVLRPQDITQIKDGKVRFVIYVPYGMIMNVLDLETNEVGEVSYASLPIDNLSSECTK